MNKQLKYLYLLDIRRGCKCPEYAHEVRELRRIKRKEIRQWRQDRAIRAAGCTCPWAGHIIESRDPKCPTHGEKK